MRWWKRTIIEVQACIPGCDGNLKSFHNPRATIITPEMASLHLVTQVQMRFREPDTIKSGKVGISQVVSKIHSRFAFDPAQSRSRECFQQRRAGVRLKKL
jgi:hypothetical protein